MRFKDEIQNIVKTQEKVKESKYAEVIENAENRAVNDYNSFKSNLKKKRCE